MAGLKERAEIVAKEAFGDQDFAQSKSLLARDVKFSFSAKVGASHLQPNKGRDNFFAAMRDLFTDLRVECCLASVVCEEPHVAFTGLATARSANAHVMMNIGGEMCFDASNEVKEMFLAFDIGSILRLRREKVPKLSPDDMRAMVKKCVGMIDKADLEGYVSLFGEKGVTYAGTGFFFPLSIGRDQIREATRVYFANAKWKSTTPEIICEGNVAAAKVCMQYTPIGEDSVFGTESGELHYIFDFRFDENLKLLNVCFTSDVTGVYPKLVTQ
eukprot:CAMPEP_0198724450 /NCGR_PEP_ID=MMETSP1475-20131203/1917_1 /TAXON_ID= ORGANISM="Unidentified sp., Strain CCMP1999" /NCGR_SAMPLE_ID=MMETSP1475 /ASSEMBLY_ACC=CAM_ASM_001111 /LENGTH=270 /DNA_ID=CAMNT_0044485983 /DNA_START=57 /DNA_END=869 /DNA_ORIENTATION=-